MAASRDEDTLIGVGTRDSDLQCDGASERKGCTESVPQPTGDLRESMARTAHVQGQAT